MRLSCALMMVWVVGCVRPCPTHPFQEAEAALSSYRDMRRPARVLRAEARVDRRDSEGRVRGTVLMFIQRPDRVRFDAMSQIVGPVAILTSDGEEFALTDMRENRFFVGPTCPRNIARLVGIPLASDEVTRLLLGESPRIEAEDQSIGCNDGRYEIVLQGAEGTRQELVYEVREADIEAPPEEQRMRLRRSELFDAEGETRWRVTYDDYRFVEDPSDTSTPRRGVVMPFDVRFEDPVGGVDTRVRFRELDLNVQPPSDAFSQTPRPGLTVAPVTCE